MTTAPVHQNQAEPLSSTRPNATRASDGTIRLIGHSQRRRSCQASGSETSVIQYSALGRNDQHDPPRGMAELVIFRHSAVISSHCFA